MKKVNNESLYPCSKKEKIKVPEQLRYNITKCFVDVGPVFILNIFFNILFQEYLFCIRSTRLYNL